MDFAAINESLNNIPDVSYFQDISTSGILRLDLSFNNISTFDGLTSYSGLEELVLDNNLVSELNLLVPYPSIKLLSLNNNQISELENFLSSVEQHFPSLTYLSCLGNPCCPDQLTDYENTEDDYRRYRYYVIYRLPKLRFLDFRPVSAKEKRAAQRHGPFLRRVRVVASATEDDDLGEQFTPLPADHVSGSGNENGAYRPCKYVYRGVHSEGNRFIRDNQL